MYIIYQLPLFDGMFGTLSDQINIDWRNMIYSFLLYINKYSILFVLYVLFAKFKILVINKVVNLFKYNHAFFLCIFLITL